MKMSVREQYKMAYRHFRIKRNESDYSDDYWVKGVGDIPLCDMPNESDLVTEGILHLDSGVVGNAIKSLEMRDNYLKPETFIDRHASIIGFKRLEEIRKNMNPNYIGIPF